MAHLNEEGKINPNMTLIDAEFFKLKKTLALYVFESGTSRMLIDTGETLSARKIVKKLKNFNLYPIQKILFTHAHWDHIQAYHRLKKIMQDTEIEVLAHENALPVLKNPEKMNEFFKYSVEPIENATPLKEGDIIKLDGLELEIFEFFGHTQDSIAIYDKKNRNLIVGDAVIDILDHDTYVPVLFGPNFNEASLLNTYKKLKKMRPMINSISFSHFGTYTDDDVDFILNNVEDMYMKAKNALIQWHEEGYSVEKITELYQESIIPNSPLFTKESLQGLQWNIEQNIECLKAAGFIK
ncbi:MAG: MBL fold metallo-hydrolase [Promethearchaeota archaeon]